jgi:membrane protein
MQKTQHAHNSRKLAASPRRADISGAGWSAVAKRVFAGLGEHDLSLVAAGVAFYAMLAIFPAVTALIAIYGLVADPADIQQLLHSGVFPPGISGLLFGQSGGHGLAAVGHGTLGLSVIVGFLVTLWSARRGCAALIEALNIVHGRLAARSLARQIGVSLVFTLAAIIFAVIVLVAVIVIPAMLERFDLGPLWTTGISAIRWPVLAILVAAGLALAYRYIPNRDSPPWRGVFVGAALATVLWLIGSALFSVYVGQFASYSRTYGTVGIVVVLLMWLWLSALIVLLGAELNAAIEARAASEAGATTAKDARAQEFEASERSEK